jgi:glycerol uptake facilitator protein
MENNFVSEMVCTMILIVFGNGVVAGVLLNQSKAQNAGWIVITFGWGMGVALAVFAGWSFSGAHINPAVTIGLASFADFPWRDVPIYISGQLVGAFLGSVLVFLAYLPHWRATEDSGLKLACHSTGPAIRNLPSNFVTEVIGTAMLLIGVLALLYDETGSATAGALESGMTPLLIGLLVFAIGLSLGGPTGYAINPARDLGPRIAHFVLPIAGKGDSDWGYAGIPVLGPIVGGILGAGIYRLFWPT